MRTALRRGLVLSLLLALTFSLVSCDGLGLSPGWTGKWEVTSFEGGEDPDNPTYWDLTKDRLRFVVDSEQGCFTNSFPVEERDGDTVTFEGDEGLFKVKFNPSDNTMTATILSSPEEDEEGDQTDFVKVDSIPVIIDNCESF